MQSPSTTAVPGHDRVAVPQYRLRVAEAAARLGLSPRGVRKAIETGRLPAQRGERGRWLLDPEDIDRLASEREPEPEPGQSYRAPSETLTPVPGTAEEMVPARVHLELVRRHEAALVRLGQLEALRDHLEIRLRELNAGASQEEAPRRSWWSLRSLFMRLR